MAARETRIEPKPGWNSSGAATLDLTRWEPVGNALDYKTTPLANYELFYRDGEVFLVKHTPGGEQGEAVYSEIFEEGGDDEADVD